MSNNNHSNLSNLNKLLAQPIIMGIVNITPDSFSDGGSNTILHQTINKIRMMEQNGVMIIDIGGQSTRPGAELISAETEWRRIEGIIKIFKKEFPNLILSVDTFYSEVASKACYLGADIINDVTMGLGDKNMFYWLRENSIHYVLMHNRAMPQVMRNYCNYNDLIGEIKLEIQNKLTDLNIDLRRLILDPGFGFSKNLEQNFILFNHLETLHTFNIPLMVGISRKSMIFKTLGYSAKEALNGTTALNMLALQKGAKILRVHDVKEANEVVKLYTEITRN